MSMIINTKAKAYEEQSHRRYPDNWSGEGWIPVPPHLEPRARAYCPYCELVIEGGALVDIVPTERPPVPEPEPTEVEKLQAEVARLRAQNELQAQQQSFLEDCLLEMGNIVYA